MARLVWQSSDEICLCGNFVLFWYSIFDDSVRTISVFVRKTFSVNRDWIWGSSNEAVAWDCPWRSLVERDEACIGPCGELLCLWTIKNYMLHMHGNFPYMFDYWAGPVAHLLLLKSSIISSAIHHSAPIQSRTYQRSVVHLSFWNPDGQRFVFRAGSSCPTAPEVHESVEIDLQLSKQNQLWQATCLLYSKGNLPTFFLNIFLNFLFHNWPMWQPNNSIKSNKPNRIMKKHRYCAWVQKRVCHHQGLNSRHRAWRSVLMFRAECDATQLSRCPQRPCANLTHKH